MCLCKHPLSINLKFCELLTQCGTFLCKPSKTVKAGFTSSLNKNEKVNCMSETVLFLYTYTQTAFFKQLSVNRHLMSSYSRPDEDLMEIINSTCKASYLIVRTKTP